VARQDHVETVLQKVDVLGSKRLCIAVIPHRR
jgi:hypothetical protein